MNDYSTRSFLDKIGLSESEINEVARKTGFLKRKPRKITPINFLRCAIAESVQANPSYNDWAIRLAKVAEVWISRQAFFKRTVFSAENFMRLVLAKAIQSKCTIHQHANNESFIPFNRIIVQDSTIVRLPLRLFGDFSGVKNAHCSVCNARVQSVIDLKTGEFVEFSVDSYKKNDLAAANELLLEENDLVLRDRGYLYADEIQRHKDKGAHCIYRHKHGTYYKNPETGETIDLLRLLKKQGSADIDIILCNDKGTLCRLVAVPVSEQIANQRRRKLKKESCHKNPSKELLELQGWTIFITTLERESFGFEDLLSLYQLRWRIEIIFKAWKSHMNFERIHNVSKTQLMILLYARCFIAVVLTHFIYLPASSLVREKYQRELSYLKTIKYLCKYPHQISSILQAISDPEKQERLAILVKYCTYEKRKRRCFNEHLNEWIGI